MPSVNRVTLVGHIGKDPELKYTPGGKAVANVSLATKNKWDDATGAKQESTVWHNLVFWGKQAEMLKEYAVKGDPLYIEGRIDNRQYDTKDGTKKSVSEIVVSMFQILSTKKDRARPDDRRPSESDESDLPF